MPTHLNGLTPVTAPVCKQRGSTLVIALFVIVVMLVLIVALSRILQSQAQTVTYEVLGTRALFMAQSGIEKSLVELLPLNTSASCSAVSGQIATSSQAGLINCKAQISCTEKTVQIQGAPRVLFQLSSVGVCGNSQTQASRTIEIEVQQ